MSYHSRAAAARAARSVPVSTIEHMQAMRDSAPLDSAVRANLDSAISMAFAARAAAPLRGAALRSRQRKLAAERRVRWQIAGIVAAFVFVGMPLAIGLGIAMGQAFETGPRFALSADIGPDSYIADSGLTIDDCRAALESAETLPAEIWISETESVPVKRPALRCVQTR